MTIFLISVCDKLSVMLFLRQIGKFEIIGPYFLWLFLFKSCHISEKQVASLCLSARASSERKQISLTFIFIFEKIEITQN